MRLLHLTFISSHLTLVDHFSFLNGKCLNTKSLKIDNCKLLIASEGGL